MNLLVAAVKPYLKLVIIASLVGLMAGLSNAGLISLIYHSNANPSHSYVQASIFFTLLGCILCCEALSQSLFAKCSQHIVAKLQTDFCKHIIATPLHILETIGSSRLLAILTQDIATLGVTATLFPSLFINSIIVLVCFIILASLSIVLFMITFVLVLIAYAFYNWLELKKIKKYFEQAYAITETILKSFETITYGAKELKQNKNRCEAFFTEQLFPATQQYCNDMIKAMRYYAIGQSTWKAHFFMGIGALLFVVPSSHKISHAVFVLLYLISPLSSLLTFFPSLRRSKIALAKITELNLGNVLDQPCQTSMECPANWNQLQFDHLMYTYPSKNFHLGPINLFLRPAEIVFIIGHNGSGKSTLSKILTGLYQADSGTITFNDLKITPTHIQGYQQLFSVLFAENYAFDRLPHFSSACDEKKIIACLTDLELEAHVSITQGLFSTVNLSTGQRKRLALLSAILEDRPFYIFDEWAANQDPAFKTIFYRNILLKLRNNNKSIVVISHDLNYLDVADRVYILENGKLIPQYGANG